MERFKKGFVLTMQYNEYKVLPFFLNHYKRFFDSTNIYIIDHGSNHAILNGYNRIFVPRSKGYSEISRLKAVTSIVNSLLQFYDWGIYCDADELVDLSRIDLGWFEKSEILYVLGYDLLFAQRSGVQVLVGRLYCGLCKPLLFRTTPNWLLGFHGAKTPPPYFEEYARAPLEMGHLKYTFGLASKENLAKRASLYATEFDSTERSHGIGVHWSRGGEQLDSLFLNASQQISDSSRWVLPNYKEVFEQDSRGFFAAKMSVQGFFKDMSSTFPHVLAQAVVPT